MSHASEPLVNKADLKVALIGVPTLFLISGCLAVMTYGIPKGEPYVKLNVNFQECKRLEQPLSAMEPGTEKDSTQNMVHQCFVDAAKNERRKNEENETKVRATQFVQLDAASGRGSAVQRASVDFMGIATGAVKSRLRDPNSAQFRDVFLNRKTLATCGEVNAKNGFGGYVGFKPFIVSAGSDFAVRMLDGDTEDFMQQWRNQCA